MIDLINDGSGLGFGIIGGRSTGVVVKTILPAGVADRVSYHVNVPLSTLLIFNCSFQLSVIFLGYDICCRKLTSAQQPLY